jgi:DNA-binding NarL/FixJ family response regulator
MVSSGPSQQPIRIFVLNDHASFLQALERYLEDECDLEVVGKGHASPRTLEPVTQAQPEVVIVDPEMHDLEVGAIIRRLRETTSARRIIVLTMNDDDQFRTAALAAGADDFILKTNAPDELVPSIRRVRMGG